MVRFYFIPLPIELLADTSGFLSVWTCRGFYVRPILLLLLAYGVVVRVRSREGRRNRAPPPRVRWKDGKKVNPAVVAAEEAKASAS